MHLLPDQLPRRVIAGVTIVLAVLVQVFGESWGAIGLQYGFIGFVLLIGLAMYLWERRHSGPLRRIAEANGWTFSRSSVDLTRGWKGSPFGTGGTRRCSSVIRGTIDGRGFVAFNYTVTDERDDKRSGGGYWSVVALEQPVGLPPVEVRSTLGGLEQAAGVDRIEVEHDAFNRRYRATCADRKLAHDVLNPRAVEAIVAGRVVHLRVGGGRAVAWAPGRLQVEEVLGWSRALVTVIDRIPDFVWKDHGRPPLAHLRDWTGPGGLTGERPSSSLEPTPLPPQESS